MVKQTLIKEKCTFNGNDSFSSLYSALRSFKKLSEQEATIYIEIIKKKSITIEDLIKILKEKGIKTTTTKPYAVIKNLMDADLLICKGKNTQKKSYFPINPRDLLLDIKESIKDLDDDVTLLESEEVQVFQEISEHSELLETEYEITSAVRTLVDKKYEIQFYFNQILIKTNDMIYKRLVKNFTLKPQEGKFCMIMASKKEEKIFRDIAILLVKDYRLDLKGDVIGIKVVDPEIFKYLAEGVKLK